VGGRPVRENTETTKDTEARRFLNERVGRVATGQPILPRVERVTYDDAVKGLRAYYERRPAAVTSRKLTGGWRTSSRSSGALG
jgi:putative component of toxin-antitoxin plasmid stabilization module